jgi:malate dehydrogenase (oxaloacetate-decarboxylating)(NADP+)
VARSDLKRVVYAEGETGKVIQAAQQVVEQQVARPILLGRRGVIEARIAAYGLAIRPGVDIDIVDPAEDVHQERYHAPALELLGRKGYSPADIHDALRQQHSVLAAMMLHGGDADAMICGSVGRYDYNVKIIERIIGLAEGVSRLTAMNGLVLDSGTFFISDAYVQQNPDAHDIAEITCLGAEAMRAFGIEPHVALLSHSNFGSANSDSASKMREAFRILRERQPDFEVEGEMHADAALSRTIRAMRFPNSRLSKSANLLIMPNQDAANIAYNMLKVLADGFVIGPILLGAARSAHVVTASITVRGLLNMTALAAVRAASNRVYD